MMYFINYQGRVVGPMAPAQVMAYDVNEHTQVCNESGQWAPLFAYPELMAVLAAKRSSSANYYHPGEPVPNSGKDHIGAGVLAILLGTLGIQYFYVGKTTAGFLSILISFCTCGMWNVITLVQGILMITMTQEEFDKKFVYTDKTFPVF